ncbi:hypothetical protein [Streptomyces albidoflavus]|uniref:hypothetical protein n=1 Tax=Streptomyces albidoflavus TaxID=1886 RepID=UPI0034061851
MARSTRPVVHYMATRPDGTVPPNIEDLARYARARGEQVPTVNLADHLGQVVDHPSPGRKWYTDRAFGYFHMYTRPGEILELIEDDWPIRVFVVEPLGETGNCGGDYRPFWLMAQQIRVIEEADAWVAFGHRGKHVLDTLGQLPGLARQWAAEWAADPEGARRTYGAWEKRVEQTLALTSWAACRARYSRREAALQTATQLAVDVAGQPAIDAGAEPHAVALIQLRARCLVAGQLVHDRLRASEYEQSIRALLLGAGLDAQAPARA